MSEATETVTPTYRTPEQEQAAKGANTPDPYDMPLEDINPLNAHLFGENRWREVFERLRAEDPVHFNEIETAGRYWSITKYKDIKAVDSDWENFSSASGITLGFAKGTQLPPGSMMQSGESGLVSQSDVTATVDNELHHCNVRRLKHTISN